MYLRAELAKLANAGDANDFVALSRCNPGEIGLPSTVAGLTAALGDQERVDAFVAALDLPRMRVVAGCCENWRGNSVAGKLLEATAAAFDAVPVDRLTVGQGEPAYRYLWERNGWSLASIAADPELATLLPYSADDPNSPVAEPRCLARADPGSWGTYRIIDGIHRAIHLVRGGASAIDLCILLER